MLNGLARPEINRLPEFQSAIMRILGWVLMMTILGMARVQGVYRFEWQLFEWLFALHLVWFLALLLHVIKAPDLRPWRTYLGILADASGTSFSIYLSGDPTSPFYLIYVWSFLSQGTRFGARNLTLASLASMLCYTTVVWVLDGWRTAPFEAGFSLFCLAILPAYEYSLIRQLHRAKQAAEAANQARGNFLATMTHELRTPLSGVIGMIGLLRDTSLDQEQRTYVESLAASATTLQSLIGDILDLSKIDAGKLEICREWFDIRSALLEVCRVLAPQAVERCIDLVCRVQPDVPVSALGDDLRFRQVLFNLVGNAIKFTERGEVVVTVAMEQDQGGRGRPQLRVSVRDTGIGIPEEKVARIFDSFWQADGDTTRKHGGTGLGTTIARDLVTLMGGTIGVESEVGKGSLFWVLLPILEPSRLKPPAPPACLEGRRVLCQVVDSALQQVLRETLEGAGMQVAVIDILDTADRSGIGDRPFDLLVISDTPQGLDLAEVAVRLRQRLGVELPVVFLHYPNRGIQVTDGWNLVLDLPCDPRALWEACMQALERGGCAKEGVRRQEETTAATLGDSGIRVLVAEDDHINARLILSLLRKAGHRVTLVRDGKSALRVAREGCFDLALIDLRMPVMDGIDFTRAWRAHEVAEGLGRRLPIIALTANMAEEAHAQCMAAGMDDFLTKPIEPQTLNALIQRFAWRTAESDSA